MNTYDFVGCYDGSQIVFSYIGPISTTKSGKTCQRWDSNSPPQPDPDVGRKRQPPHREDSEKGGELLSLLAVHCPVVLHYRPQNCTGAV